jgi:DNA-binding MarR family transcriptional regulator
MTSVNPWTPPPDERHAVMLMGMLMQRIRHDFAAEDWGGLRQSHFRVISSVPPDGISITELGDRVGMTKQGCGQFVTQLVESGHLTVEANPADRRTRVVKRTALGNRTIKKVTARNRQIEEEWSRQVGSKRYQAFWRVLEQLALGD